MLLAKLFPDISKALCTFMSRVKHLELFDPEDEGSMIFCNTDNYLPLNTASPPSSTGVKTSNLAVIAVTHTDCIVLCILNVLKYGSC